MARPSKVHSPAFLPGGDAGFRSFWLWVATLYQYVWDGAWKLTASDGTKPLRNPTAETRTGDPAQDLDLYALSRRTAPLAGADQQRDLSVSSIERILTRNFKSVGRLRLQPLWFLAVAGGLDPLNLKGGRKRARALKKANIPDAAWSVSDAHSLAYGQFLHALRTQLEERVLQEFSDGDSDEPDYVAWSSATIIVPASRLRDFWWSTVATENMLLIDLWATVACLDTPSGTRPDEWAYTLFGA